jgi:HPt (histidine-containing phosphotransfer) domain-containing protein
MDAEQTARDGRQGQTSDAAVLDRATALERIGGDSALLRDIARLFLQEYPMLLAQIRTAFTGGDAREVERAAHSLKGAAANFCAAPTVQAALAVETLARGGDVSGAGEPIARLEAELARMHRELAELGGVGAAD